MDKINSIPEKYAISSPISEDFEQIRKLFFDYPYKSFQQRFQGIDKGILADFFAESFIKSSSTAKSSSFIIKSENKLDAIGGAAFSDWHTSNFGINMGRVSNFNIVEGSSFTQSALYNIIMGEAAKLNIEHISVRFDADDWKNIHFFERNGFYLVDCSVKFGLKLPSPIKADPSSNIKIVPYSPEYLPAIMEIASSSHQTNHFYADPNLSRQKTQSLFANWVKRLAGGNAKSIFVALKDSTPIGFIIFLENKGFNQRLNVRVAILDYVVLDSKLQGCGLGSTLLASTLNLFKGNYDHVELRTSHNNYPAVNLYQKFGFRLISTDIVMHKIIV